MTLDIFIEKYELSQLTSSFFSINNKLISITQFSVLKIYFKPSYTVKKYKSIFTFKNMEYLRHLSIPRTLI